MPRRFCFIVNPAAGGGRGLHRWRHWERWLRPHGIQGEVLLSSRPGLAIELARRAAPNFDVLVAAGGDGTALEVATGWMQARTEMPRLPSALGFLPLGSGNDVAVLLGVRDPQVAIVVLRHAAPRGMDVIDVDCRNGPHRIRRTALCVAASGIGADIIALAPTRLKRRVGGTAAYVIAFFRALARFHPTESTLHADGRTSHHTTTAVILANHTHAGGGSMHIGPGASAYDGHLALSVVRSVSRAKLALQFFRLVRGTHVHDPAIEYRSVRQLDLETDVPVGIQADGEILGHTPASFRILPSALPVLSAGGCPAPQDRGPLP